MTSTTKLVTMSVGRPTRFVKLSSSSSSSSSNPSSSSLAMAIPCPPLKSWNDDDEKADEDHDDHDHHHHHHHAGRGAAANGDNNIASSAGVTDHDDDNEYNDVLDHRTHTMTKQVAAACMVLQRYARGCLARWKYQRALQRIARRREASSIVLQRTIRGFLARQQYQSMLATIEARRQEQAMLEQILEQARLEQRRMQRQELRQMEQRVLDIQEQTKVDVKLLKEQFKEGKRALKERARRKFNKMMFKLEQEQKAEQDAQDAMTLLELSELGAESKRWKAEIAQLERDVTALTEENQKLQKANNDVATLFRSLNDFAMKQTMTKKKLVLAIQKLSKMYKPKLQSDIHQGTIACQLELKLRALYRKGMYKIAQGLQGRDLYDRLLYEDVMRTITECEQSLGCDVLLNEHLHPIMEEEENVDEKEDVSDVNERQEAIPVDRRGVSSEIDPQSLDESNDDSLSKTIHTKTTAAKGFGQASTSGQGDPIDPYDDDAEAWGGRATLDAFAVPKSTKNPLDDFSSSFLWGDDEDWTSSSSTWCWSPNTTKPPSRDRRNATNSYTNLNDLLDQKLELTDIDCQSLHSWRTEHESLMVSLG